MRTCFVAAIAILAALAGCSTGPAKQMYWVKIGSTQAEFNRTMASCRMQLARLPQPDYSMYNTNTAGGAISMAGREIQDAAEIMSFMDDCLEANGWTPEYR